MGVKQTPQDVALEALNKDLKFWNNAYYASEFGRLRIEEKKKLLKIAIKAIEEIKVVPVYA